MTNVAVIGAGSWGTAVASLAAANGPTVLWARREETARQIHEEHRNEDYLPGYGLPTSLRATHHLEQAVADADVLVMGVPSHGVREVLYEAARFVPAGIPVISLSKGVEQGTNRRVTQVITEILSDHPVGVLTGPNLAKEVMAGHPAASVVAMDDHALADRLALLFAGERFRVYTNTDVIGSELAGALKNVMAIAAGMADGLGFGDNTKAAVITRGLAELARLGAALGGKVLTFGGLAGLGDLVATCTSPQSRNRSVGEQLGRGRSIEDITAEMRMVAEGVKSCRPVRDLGRAHGLELPIVEQVCEVVTEGRSAADAVSALLARPTGPELWL